MKLVIIGQLSAQVPTSLSSRKSLLGNNFRSDRNVLFGQFIYTREPLCQYLTHTLPDVWWVRFLEFRHWVRLPETVLHIMSIPGPYQSKIILGKIHPGVVKQATYVSFLPGNLE
jgi:hypothetical protein